MGLHFVSTTPAEEAELNIIRAETGRRVALCRRREPHWCARDPLLVWLVPRSYADPAAWRLGEPARSEVFEVFRVDPERFPALAARIALAAEEDEAALRADHAEGDAERGQCEARP